MAFFKRHPKGTPYKVVAAHFPLATRDLVPLGELVRLGMLILGYRDADTLNVGLLDLSKRAHLADVERTLGKALGEKKTAIRFYRISAEDFQEVLTTIYGMLPPTTTERSSLET